MQDEAGSKPESDPPNLGDIVACRGCGKPIRFIKYNDKPHPVDAMPARGFVWTEGKIERATATGHPLSCQASHWTLSKTYISHFATCPKADEFRSRSND